MQEPKQKKRVHAVRFHLHDILDGLCQPNHNDRKHSSSYKGGGMGGGEAEGIGSGEGGEAGERVNPVAQKTFWR